MASAALAITPKDRSAAADATTATTVCSREPVSLRHQRHRHREAGGAAEGGDAAAGLDGGARSR